MTTTNDARSSSYNGSSSRDLAEVADSDDGDRISVTDVNGTVARFEMSYNLAKGERHAFGPTLVQRIPSFVYFGFAVAIVLAVVVAHVGSSNSALYVWIVEGDRGRPLGSSTLAFLVFLSGLATLVRAHMRGVVVHADGLEARYLLALGVPRIKRWAWPQVHRMIVDDEQIMLELWDGRYERLPDVAQPKKLSDLLEKIAGGRNIAVTRLKTTPRPRS